MTTGFLKAIFLIAVYAISTRAMAHIGADSAAHHGAGFADGLLHPLTGLDHLAAMLAVGFWSALTARRMWMAPLAFAAMLGAGALAGMAGVATPAAEPMIAASLLVLGLLVGMRTPLPALASVALVGGFALFHGLSHGAEMAAAQPWAALLGMLASTLGLHAAGLALGLALRNQSHWWPRAAGALLALFAVSQLAQLA